MPVFKLLMILFIISSALISCNKKDELYENQNLTTISANEVGSCIQVFSYDNETIPIDIRKVGYFHNQILGQFTRPPFIDDVCNRADYNVLQSKLENLIQSDIEYSDFFGNVHTKGMAALYLDVYKLCDTNPSKHDSIVLNVIEKANFMLKDYLNTYELGFFKDFFEDGLNNRMKPVIEYVKIIEQNRNKFIDNGKFALAVLSVFDNSYCFWSSIESKRVCPPCINFALRDATGAFLEGSWDLANNGGAPSENFIKRLGRGALDGSIPYVGGKIANWLGW